MFERKLTVPGKIWLVSLTIFSAATGIMVLILAITETLPWLPRVGLFVGVAFAAAWTAYFVQLLRRGTFRLRIDAPLAAAMAFVFSLLMCVLFAVAGMPADLVVLNAVLFLLPAGLMLVNTTISQAEMRTQERIVELEYKIALLDQKLGGGEDYSGVLR